ncbi:hypothetical protein [Microbacterium sp. PM5]|uniref:hypothetical protein n=1 Tax=Microbacterium sp. PM5 TaxID=2014534 RepID=UPI0013AFB5AA|nr:hypothetical protein [Microbacterium sp. PM5]
MYTLLVSLLASLPFADLGLGASVVNATSDRESGRISAREYNEQVRSTLTILVGVTGAIILIAALITSLDGWRFIFGEQESSSTNLAALFLGVMLALSVPLGLGVRILQGLGKNQVATLLAFTGSIAQGLWIFACIGLGAEPAVFALSAGAGLLTTSVVTFIVASKLAALEISSAFRIASRPNFISEYKPTNSALPYMIVIMGVTATLQLQRILLALVSNDGQVASYGYVAQFTVAVTSVITLASMNLWPRYRSLRAQFQLPATTVASHILTFTIVGAALGTLSSAAALILRSFITHDSITVSMPTVIAAATVVAAWAATRPSTLFLNYPAGFWLQAASSVACAASSVALTVTWGRVWGAAGAFAANAFSIAAFVAVPMSAATLMILVRERRSTSGE